MGSDPLLSPFIPKQKNMTNPAIKKAGTALSKLTRLHPNDIGRNNMDATVDKTPNHEIGRI